MKKPESTRVFADYVRAAQEAADDIAFVLDHIGARISLDFSAESLEMLEDLYWNAVEGKTEMPDGLLSTEDFGALLCRYMGECVIRKTSGHWVQSRERNRRQGQPCVDGFGNKPWERIYPVELAKNLSTLPKTNPLFPGVQERRVLATQLRLAMSKGM